MSETFEPSPPSPDRNPSNLTALKVPPHSVEAEQAVLGGVLLDLAGFDGQAATQSEGALHMVRGIAAFGPAVFLGLAIWASRGYALTRQRHADIIARLS